jgi:hypothetical protein
LNPILRSFKKETCEASGAPGASQDRAFEITFATMMRTTPSLLIFLRSWVKSGAWSRAEGRLGVVSGHPPETARAGVMVNG